MQGKNWENIQSGWKQTSANTSLLSEHLTKRNAVEGAFTFSNKIPQLFLSKDLPLIAVPRTCLFSYCCPFILLKAGRGVPSAALLGFSKWVRFGRGPPGTAQLQRAD